MIYSRIIQEILRTRSNGHLFHREGQELEFKEQFNFGGMADYLRDFAAFANNRGGHIVFGVTDRPRRAKGLSSRSAENFERIDPERISGFLLDIFSPSIDWEQQSYEISGALFGVFRIAEARVKPVIAKKDEGKNGTIRNREIYYRYGGRSQKIQYAELESIINKRIQQNNDAWLDLVTKINHAGPNNAAVLDTEKSIIEKNDVQILVVDDALARKLRFIKEGHFDENLGMPTLKLIGDVVPMQHLEVIKRVRENLTKAYPLSATELADEVQNVNPEIKRSQIWDAIRENGLKENPDYAAYNFRNKRQEDEYRSTGVIASGTPTIYNQNAVKFLLNVLNHYPEES
jgi:hypothetical protein